MLNSLSSELDVLRPSMLESGLEVIQYNCNRKNNDLRLYEFGKVYREQDNKYIEDWQLAIYVTGETQPAHWSSKSKTADMLYLKGLIEHLLVQNGIENIAKVYKEDIISWVWDKETLCEARVVDVKKLQAFDIKQDVFYAIINRDTWVKAATTGNVTYTEVPKFPAVQRDLAIVIDKEISYQEVEEITGQLKLDALTSFGLFDVFESEKLGAGKKSYALNYTFQLQDRTLTDTEIEKLMQQLANAYKNKLQAQIRE
jgi:phenylalanyl-tRNA synthetase beta chain